MNDVWVQSIEQVLETKKDGLNTISSLKKNLWTIEGSEPWGKGWADMTKECVLQNTKWKLWGILKSGLAIWLMVEGTVESENKGVYGIKAYFKLSLIHSAQWWTPRVSPPYQLPQSILCWEFLYMLSFVTSLAYVSRIPRSPKWLFLSW